MQNKLEIRRTHVFFSLIFVVSQAHIQSDKRQHPEAESVHPGDEQVAVSVVGVEVQCRPERSAGGGIHRRVELLRTHFQNCVHIFKNFN